MKKVILLLVVSLGLSCSKETEADPKECDCKAKTYVNGVFNSQQFTYSKDCNDNGKVLQSYTERGFVVKEVVECN